MRLVIAVLRPSQVQSVRRALAAVDVTRMTLCDGQGFIGNTAGEPLQETIVQIACNDDFLGRVTAAIRGVLEVSGEDPSSRLFTLPLAEVVHGSGAARGPEAV